MPKNWKEHLSKEDEKRLNDILHKVEKYRRAYRASEEVATSQFWSAMLEHKKGNERILRRMEILESLAKRQKPVIVEKLVKEKKLPSSYWQLPVGAVPLLLSLLILANISVAESASQASFVGSLAIAFSFIVFAGILWFSTFKD